MNEPTTPTTTPTTGAVSLPLSPGDVTPAWLTAALNAYGLDVDVSTIRRASLGEGVGMMSGLERLEIEYSRGTGPAVLILKMPATNDANRAVAESFDLYRREVLVYRNVAPHSAAHMPTVYYAAIEGHSFVLLMEDLSAYELGDQVRGCTIEQATDGIAWLGRHHASLWGRTDDPNFAFLPLVHPSYSSDALVQGCAFGWDPMLSIFGEVIPIHIAALREKYLAAAPRLFEWMATPPLTVTHGDFRMDNLFFGSTPGQEPLIAVDWQGSLRGRASQDVAYFLSGSLPIDLRRTHERQLIAQWHRQLVDNGVGDYSLDNAWEDYRRAVLSVWIIAVVIAGTLDATNERGKRWITEMLARSVAAIDDLDLVTLLDDFV